MQSIWLRRIGKWLLSQIVAELLEEIEARRFDRPVRSSANGNKRPY